MSQGYAVVLSNCLCTTTSGGQDHLKTMVEIAQGTPVSQGLTGPRELFDFVTSSKGKVVHTIDHLFVSDNASLAVMIGSVEAVIENAGMDATGTYLFVLEPDDDGWDIVTDMWHQHTQQECPDEGSVRAR